MDSLISILSEAKVEITAGLVLALLGGLYSKYRAFLRMYKLKKQELERINAELAGNGDVKHELEHLRKELRESEAQRQDLQAKLSQMQAELYNSEEALRQSETQCQDLTTRLEGLRGELQSKNEALRQAEQQNAEEAQRREDMQKQLEAQQQKQEHIIAALKRYGYVTPKIGLF